MNFTEEQIDSLRDRVRQGMSEYRFVHTAEVEKMAVRLGELYAPNCIDILRVAALLHDITKEKTTEEQVIMLREHGIEPAISDLLAPKTLHARTAELAVTDLYPEYAMPEVLSAVRRHTTGHKDMTVCDMIIYLADYIDMSRRFPDCVALREAFWKKEPQNMAEDERMKHLLAIMLRSFDMTINALVTEGTPISLDTVDARNAVLCRLLNMKN